QPALVTTIIGGKTKLDPRVLGAGKWVAVLFNLDSRFRLVHDRIDRNVRLVEVLESDSLPRRRRPVAAQAIEVFLGDIFREPVRGTGRVRCAASLAPVIDRPDVALANKKRP